MGNPKRRHSTKHYGARSARRRRHNEPNPRRRRHNPRYYARHNVRRYGYRRHRRNPQLNAALLAQAAWASAGAVGTRTLTQTILGARNEGLTGYVGNIVAAVGLGWLVERFASPGAGQAVTLGGLIATVMRVAKEKLFAAGPMAEQMQLQGLGDADYALTGYVNDPFALPSVSTGPDQLQQPLVLAAPATGRAGMADIVPGGYEFDVKGKTVDRFAPPWE